MSRLVRAGAAVAVAVALALAGCSASGTGTTTDEEACAGFGDAGVEQRLGEVYDDEAASQALLDEYDGADRFQGALRQTLELLRSTDGELEGDFLAQACSS